MTYRTIRDAQQAIWPAVQASIERHRASREKVKLDGRAATAAAQARARVPWNRVVANEAVWAIAKADLLATKEQAAVVQAAREWAKSWGDDFADMVPADEKLYDAVQVLVATPSIDTEEDLTLPPA